MMEAAYRIGKYLIEVEGRDINEVLTERPNVQNIMILKLELNGEILTNFSIDIEKYDFKKHNRQYPYRRGPSQGAGLVPAAILTNARRTFNGKILAWFRKNEEKSPLIEKTKIYLEKESGSIIEEFENRLQDFNTRERFLLTIDFIPTDQGRLFWKEIIEGLKDEILNKFANKHGTTSKGKGICYHCEKESELYGFASPFAFYTHDKVTYSPNFDRVQVWKQYPVCGNCAFITEFGAKEIRQNFNFNFYGHNYWLFPKFLSWESMEEVMWDLRNYVVGVDPTTGNRRVNLRGNLTNDENEILEVLSDEDDTMTVTLLFYKRNNSQVEILTVIHDVLPSRLHQLYEAKVKVETTSWLADWWNGLPIGKENMFQFNFGNVRQVFPSSFSKEGGRNDLFGQQFLEMTGAAFSGRKLDGSAFLHPAILQIRHLFANRNQEDNGVGLELIFLTFIHSVAAVLEYYRSIGCIGGSPMEIDTEQILKELNIERSQLAKKILDLTNSSSFFDNSYKKAVFIVGILTHMVTFRQHQELKSKPFFEKLDGLRLNPRKIQRLFPEVIAKLTEYDANRMEASALETLASKFFMDQKPIPTNEEISFAFAMGLSYGNAIWQGYQKKTDKEENK